MNDWLYVSCPIISSLLSLVRVLVIVSLCFLCSSQYYHYYICPMCVVWLRDTNMCARCLPFHIQRYTQIYVLHMSCGKYLHCIFYTSQTISPVDIPSPKIVHFEFILPIPRLSKWQLQLIFSLSTLPNTKHTSTHTFIHSFSLDPNVRLLNSSIFMSFTFTFWQSYKYCRWKIIVFLHVHSFLNWCTTSVSSFHIFDNLHLIHHSPFTQYHEHIINLHSSNHPLFYFLVYPYPFSTLPFT